MTHIFAMLVPLIFLSSFLFAVYKKVHIYDSFTKGIQQAVPLVLSVFPYVAAVTMLAKLLEISGVGSQLAKWLAPLFDLLYASFSTTKYAILPAGTVALPSCTQP